MDRRATPLLLALSLCGYGIACADPPLGAPSSIALGGNLSCAVTDRGVVACWGANFAGQVGDGSLDPAHVPRAAIGVNGAVSVAVGEAHACALTETPSAFCWGRNDHGQVGDGSTDDKRRPTRVAGLDDAVQIAAGGAHSCAVRAGGEVACWGSGSFGQLGDGEATDRSSPTPVVDVEGAVEVRLGFQHSCARTARGAVDCWGVNEEGQLGYGGLEPLQDAPVRILSLTDATAIAIGNEHSCALLASGTVSCWGSNASGQLGDPVRGLGGRSLEPAVVPALSDVTAIAAGAHHTCAALRDGKALCWGENDAGQVGDGSTIRSPFAAEVVELSRVVGVAAGAQHSCALRQGSQVVCWGRNGWGQLGDGSTTDRTGWAPVGFE